MNKIEEEQKRLKKLMEIIDLNKTGFAGILPNGNIVDRRVYPNAIPIQENSLLGVPKPKKLKNDKHNYFNK
jgi:hypothetical protein